MRLYYLKRALKSLLLFMIDAIFLGIFGLMCIASILFESIVSEVIALITFIMVIVITIFLVKA